MAKVYCLNTEDTSDQNTLIPSIEYILESILNGAEPDKEYEALPTCDSVHSENVTQDARHMFISQSKLAELENKPSFADMSTAIDSMASTIENNNKQLYINLLNMPDAVGKLKDIATLIKEDDNISALAELFSSKVDNDTLENHANNTTYHLTVEDRKALDMLLKLVETGYVDWEADESSLGYIKNKPTSMKADGGNADTVGGLPLSWVANKREHDMYLGVDGNGYEEIEVDMMIEKEPSSALNIAFEGSVFFRKGNYKLPSLMLSPGTDKYLTLCGNGASANISSEEVIKFPKNLSVRDIRFSNSTIYIGSNNDIHDVVFENCTVYFDTVSFTTIECCRFIGSTFTFVGSCLSNMIIHNRANSDIKFMYKGGNNIIDSNLSC